MEPTVSKKKEYFSGMLGKKGTFFSVLSKKDSLPDHSKFQFEFKILCTTRSVP